MLATVWAMTGQEVLAIPGLVGRLTTDRVVLVTLGQAGLAIQGQAVALSAPTFVDNAQELAICTGGTRDIYRYGLQTMRVAPALPGLICVAV